MAPGTRGQIDLQSLLPVAPAQLAPQDDLARLGRRREVGLGPRRQVLVDGFRALLGHQVEAAALGDEEVALVRDKIKLEDQAAKSQVIQGLDGMDNVKVGIIEVPAFYRDFQGESRGDKDFRSTTRDVRALLGELQTWRADKGFVLRLAVLAFVELGRVDEDADNDPLRMLSGELDKRKVAPVQIAPGRHQRNVIVAAAPIGNLFSELFSCVND